MAIVMIFVFSFGVYQQEAKAFALILAHPAVVSAVCGLVTAAGITFVTNEGARAGAQQAWSTFSDSLKNKIHQAVTTGQGVLGITPSDWEEIKRGAEAVQDGQVDVFINEGDFIELENLQTSILYCQGAQRVGMFTGTITGDSYIACGFTNNYNTQITTGQVWTGSQWEYQLYAKYSLGGGAQQKLILDTSATRSFEINVMAGSYDGNSYVDVNGVGVWQVSNSATTLNSIEARAGYGSGSKVIGLLDSFTSQSVTQNYGDTYIHNEYYQNPAYDLSNQNVTLPSTLDNVINPANPGEVLDIGGAIVVPPGVGDDNVPGWLGALYQALSKISDFLNPASKNNLLYRSLVPTADYFPNFRNELKHNIDLKIPIIPDLTNAWDSIKTSAEKDNWDGISYDNPIIGNVIIVDPLYVNDYMVTIKRWIGGGVLMLTLVMTFRRIGGLVGGDLH